jgi:SAM-dependent methyltransferase
VAIACRRRKDLRSHMTQPSRPLERVPAQVRSLIHRFRSSAWPERRWVSLPNRTSATAMLQLYSGQFISPVLDLGCGTGHLTVELASRGCRLVALDLAPESLLRLHGIIARHDDLPDIKPVGGNGLSLPFRDAVFGTLICNSVLEHIEDDRKVVSEMARVLRDHGTVLITVPNRGCRFGDQWAFFWRLLWRMPIFFKRMIGNHVLLSSDSPGAAALTIDARYKHCHLYTPDSIHEMIGPYFSVMRIDFYMRSVGGFAHDITLVFKPFFKRMIIAILPVVIMLDKRVGRGSPGKGFAVTAVRIPGAPDG